MKTYYSSFFIGLVPLWAPTFIIRCGFTALMATSILHHARLRHSYRGKLAIKVIDRTLANTLPALLAFYTARSSSRFSRNALCFWASLLYVTIAYYIRRNLPHYTIHIIGTLGALALFRDRSIFPPPPLHH